MNEKRSFSSELRRRNVYKVAVAYAVVGWLVIQVTATIVPALHLPDGLTTAVVVLVPVGFPIALVISWAFEMTPEGMKRTADVSPDEVWSMPYWSKRKFSVFIVAVVVIAAGLLAYQLLRGPRSAVASIADTKSIAVLPFENLSEDKNNAYFADGVQEEILTRLSKIADLKVISRTSTQRFKSAPADLKEIAKQLGVANILEGSVQKASDQVRISVQLINALSDSHLWAETYDRKLADVFQVESDLAQKIAASLEAKLTGREKKEITARGTNNPEAYDDFLHALAASNRQGTQDLEDLVKFARRAVELDPNFAQAWFLLALGESQKYFYPDTNEGQLAKARTAAQTTIRLAPDSAEGPAALGVFSYYCLHDWDAALAQLQIARERAPNDANVLLSIGLVKRRQGHVEESISVQQEAAKLDPLNEDIWTNIGRGYRGLRRFEEARTMFDRALSIAPDDLEIVAARAETYMAQGDLAAAWKIMEPLEFNPTDRGFGEKITLLVFQRRFDEAERMIKATGSKDLPPLFVAISRFGLGQAHVARGDRAGAQPLFLQAQSDLNKLRAAGENGLLLRSVLLGVEAHLGHRDETRGLADSLLETTRNDAWQLPNTEEDVARAYVALGDFDRAFPLLEHALHVPGVEVLTTAYLRLDPSWDPIRNDPRFQKLCEEDPK
jgi:TolB-like protein/cytochrome c-type biogenesis protein CcmH/NrfG